MNKISTELLELAASEIDHMDKVGGGKNIARALEKAVAAQDAAEINRLTKISLSIRSIEYFAPKDLADK